MSKLSFSAMHCHCCAREDGPDIVEGSAKIDVDSDVLVEVVPRISKDNRGFLQNAIKSEVPDSTVQQVFPNVERMLQQTQLWFERSHFAEHNEVTQQLQHLFEQVLHALNAALQEIESQCIHEHVQHHPRQRASVGLKVLSSHISGITAALDASRAKIVQVRQIGKSVTESETLDCMGDCPPTPVAGQHVVEQETGSKQIAGHQKTESAIWTDAKSGKTHDQYVSEIWAATSRKSKSCVNFFGHDNIRICEDGGLEKVTDLLSPLKYAQGMMVAMLITFNVSLVLYTDISLLRRRANRDDDMFLITQWLISGIFSVSGFQVHDFSGRAVSVFSAVEILVLLVMLSRFFKRIAIMLMMRHDECGEMKRWTAASRLFRSSISNLQHYSGMRLLHFVTPTIIGTDFWIVLLHAWQRCRRRDIALKRYVFAVVPVFNFLMLRSLALIIGIDAFFVKFRAVKHHFEMTAEWTNTKTWECLAFFYQLLGILSVTRFVKERLFIFIFGGKDGNLDCDEEALVQVWHALLIREVYNVFGCWKGTLVMLGFDDYDFQMLALDDDEQEIRSRASLNSRLSRRTPSSNQSLICS